MEMQERIDYVLDEFNFDKANRAMTALEWEWRGEGVPSIAEMRRQARYLLNRSVQHNCVSRCGGFEASYVDDTLTLRFVIDQVEERTHLKSFF